MTGHGKVCQVAEHAGVSYQTVSRVIDDRPEVAAETRARVLASIQALNDRPSRAARALRQRTSIIGLVIPFEPDDLFTDPHFLWVVHGIARELTLHDYSPAFARMAPPPRSRVPSPRSSWAGVTP